MNSVDQRLMAYARDALSILSVSLDLCQKGHPEFYRVAAVQLRLLLCDTTHRHNELVDIALLPRLVPELTLPIITHDGIAIPSRFLPLQDWLDQMISLGEQAMTIRQLIRRVCDQDGGAHVDTRPSNPLSIVSDPAQYVIRIGELVLQYCPDFPGS